MSQNEDCIAEFLEYISYKATVEHKFGLFPDVVGWYDTKAPPTAANESLKCFFDQFEATLGECVLLSSLTESVAASEFWGSGEGKQLSEELYLRGWLTIGSTREQALTRFSVSCLCKEDASLLKKLCQLEFEGVTFGYVFLYWKETGMVAFPQKYEGFTFIAKRDRPGYQIAREFLIKLSVHSPFLIEIKS